MWKDVTSYSRSDTERKPSTFQLSLPGGLRLVIVWGHRDYPKEWICHLHPWWSEVRLGVTDYAEVEAVKEIALGRVIRQLENTLVYAKEAASHRTTGKTVHSEIPMGEEQFYHL